MWAAILLLGVGLVAAQQPKPCDSPTQFEGKVLVKEVSKNVTRYARLVYDEDDKRVLEVEETLFGDTRDLQYVLYLFNQQKEYRLNLSDRKCNTTALTRPFIPLGVPPNAEYTGQGTMGPVNIPGEHLDFISFKGQVDDGEFYGTVTTKDCLPVTFGFYSNRTGVEERTFFDNTLGISDPEAFNIPRECTP